MTNTHVLSCLLLILGVGCVASTPSPEDDGTEAVADHVEALRLNGVLVVRLPEEVRARVADGASLRIVADKTLPDGTIGPVVLSNDAAFDPSGEFFAATLDSPHIRGLDYRMEVVSPDLPARSIDLSPTPASSEEDLVLFGLPNFGSIPIIWPDIIFPPETDFEIVSTSPSRGEKVPRVQPVGLPDYHHRLEVRFSEALDCGALATMPRDHQQPGAPSLDSAFHVVARRPDLASWRHQTMYHNTSHPRRYDWSTGREDTWYRGHLECEDRTLRFFFPGPLLGASRLFVHVVATSADGDRLTERLELEVEDPIIEVDALEYYNDYDKSCDGVADGRRRWRKCDVYFLIPHAIADGSEAHFGNVETDDLVAKFPLHGVWDDMKLDTRIDLTDGGHATTIFRGRVDHEVFFDFWVRDEDDFSGAANAARVMGNIGNVISSAFGYAAAGEAGRKMHNEIARVLRENEDDDLGNRVFSLHRDEYWGLAERQRTIVIDKGSKGTMELTIGIEESPRSWISPTYLL